MLAFHLKGQQRWRPCLSLSPAHSFRWVSSLAWSQAPYYPHSCNCLLSCHQMSALFCVYAHARDFPCHTGLDPFASPPSVIPAGWPTQAHPYSSEVRTITIFPAHSCVDPVQLSRSFLSAALLACLLGATSPSSPYLVNLARCSRQESLEVALAKPGFGEATLEALASDCGRAQPLLAIP